MTYITTDVNTVFGIYYTVESVEKAVDTLGSNGFPCNAIFVLHPKNEATRDFARRKNASSKGNRYKSSRRPAAGWNRWVSDMAHEPRQGALPTALRDMGVPADWSDNRAVE
jgi:hypothetical protein